MFGGDLEPVATGRQERELDDEVETVMSRAVKKASQRIWGKRPVVETTVLRI